MPVGGALPVAPLLSILLRLAGPLLTIAFPAMASFEALERRDNEDQQQWLTYWVLYSVMQVLEMYGGPVIAWIPLFSWLKLAFLGWLAFPQTRGAQYLFTNFIRPHGQKVRTKAYEQFGDYSPYFKGPASKKVAVE
eukprot:TRINITY_DN5420_c0_g2_i1.p1 TRINITY_DN5420_c0_g2~~TRINITY_DN5420_c0_g2_i1.p1  ORF type:complete len:136 (+),score=15.71 TRINITY_DN5420_c0_g2_i1:152-559(+)